MKLVVASPKWAIFQKFLQLNIQSLAGMIANPATVDSSNIEEVIDLLRKAAISEKIRIQNT